MVFDTPETRRHVLPAPAFHTECRPTVVVVGMTTHINHAIDAARAAEHLAAQPDFIAMTVTVIRLHRDEPRVSGIAQQFAESFRHADQWAGIFRTRLDQHD